MTNTDRLKPRFDRSPRSTKNVKEFSTWDETRNSGKKSHKKNDKLEKNFGGKFLEKLSQLEKRVSSSSNLVFSQRILSERTERKVDVNCLCKVVYIHHETGYQQPNSLSRKPEHLGPTGISRIRVKVGGQGASSSKYNLLKRRNSNIFNLRFYTVSNRLSIGGWNF